MYIFLEGLTYFSWILQSHIHETLLHFDSLQMSVKRDLEMITHLWGQLYG